MAMPDFIGIGAQKAGTTWLYDMLAQNPSIWLPPLKEVHFFDRQNATPEQKINRGEHIEQNASKIERGRLDKGSEGDSAEKAAFLRSLIGDHIFSDEWYGSIFDHPETKGRITGEITPSYLELSAAEMPKVKALLPDAKFIAIIREPLSRMLSQIKMGVARAKATPETRDDWDFFLKKLERNRRGSYDRAIPNWQSFFGPEQLLVLPFGMLKTDPAGMLHQIEDFIGAERFDGYKALTEQVHKTKEVVVPDWVVALLDEMNKPQKDYLIKAFGEEFYKNTR